MSRKAERQRAIKALVEDGPPQLPGVSSASLKAILQREAERPLRGGERDLGHDGLFGDGHRQRELF